MRYALPCVVGLVAALAVGALVYSVQIREYDAARAKYDGQVDGDKILRRATSSPERFASLRKALNPTPTPEPDATAPARNAAALALVAGLVAGLALYYGAPLRKRSR
jgi:hypothetical protein